MHLKHLSYWTKITIICCFCTCQKGPYNYNDPEFVVPIIQPTGTENYLSNPSDYIFDQNSLHTFELKLPGAALHAIDSNPTAEQYVEGMLIFEGDTLSPVGIRYKGSVGAFVGGVSGPNWADPSGYKTATKLSMKVKINWKGIDRMFFGLKKLQFHSQNQDASQMRERLGYWLFRQMGVAAPRSVHARLLINGRYYGLYALTEQIDGRFTKHHFDDGDGNLYKECWPLNSNGQAKSSFEYRNSLKTNEEDNLNPTMIASFAQEVASSNSFNLPAILDQWLDMQKIMAYVVTDRAIKHDDGPFHWYCFDNYCESHNFYWYEETSFHKLHLIPWDLDNAFENLTSQNAITHIADPWAEASNNCQPFGHGALGLQQWSAACDKLTGGWTLQQNLYAQQKALLINGPLSTAQADVQLDRWTAQVRAATTEAAGLYSDAISVADWENNVESLKAQLVVARAQ